MSSTLLASLVTLAILLLSVGWVHLDASNHVTAGEPVVFWSERFQLETPSAWAAVCLVCWVIFFPLYLRARQHSL
jgi:hypothetical protein